MSLEQSENLFVRVKIEENYRFVPFNKNESDVKSFLTAGLTTFGIDADDDIEVEMFDNYNTPISTTYFDGLIRQYAHSSSFYIRLNVLRGKGSILLPSEIEKYLIAKKGQYILSEYTATKQLCSKTVASLCDELLSFIRERDSKFSRPLIENVCETVIKMFPCLRWEPSKLNGIDLLYDPINRKGALYQKIVYAKAKERRFQQSAVPRNDTNEVESASVEEFTEDERAELILFFKTCVVHNNKQELKEKLRETVNFRRSLISGKDNRFPELFPFYFVDAELILYDLEITFTAIRSTALMECWAKVKLLIIRNIFDAKRDAQFLVDYEEDMAYFLILSKHLCSTKGFETQKFFVFSEDMYKDPRELRNSKIANPIIIALGETMTKISNYYIAVEQELVTVPANFNFVQLMDLFFKVHKVFNLRYFSNILNALNFFEFFVYEMKSEDVKPNLKMMNLSKHLLSNASSPKKNVDSTIASANVVEHLK